MISRGMINNYSLIVMNIIVISVIRLTMMCHCNSCWLSDNVGGHRGRDRMVVGFTTTLVCIQCLSPLMLWVRTSIRARCTTLCEKFVSDLRQAGGFLWVLRFPPPIKLIATIYNVAVILSKVALNTIRQIIKQTMLCRYNFCWLG